MLEIATEGFNTLFNGRIAAALNGTNYKIMSVDREMESIKQNDGSYTTDGVTFQFDMGHFSEATCQPLLLGDQYQSVNVPLLGAMDVQALVKDTSVSALTCNPEVGVDASGDPIKLDNPPKHHFFEDAVHPTSQVHSVIAHKLKETILYQM